MSIGGFELDEHLTAIDLIDAEAAGFLAGLQNRFGGRRTQLLEARRERLRRIDSGERLTFLAETECSNLPTNPIRPSGSAPYSWSHCKPIRFSVAT